MQNKLLPCPFCGGEAIKEAFTWANISDESTIVCTVCGARTKVLKTEEAIKCWNTRKPMERIVEQLEEKKWDIHDWRDRWRNEIIDECIDVVKGGVDNATN